MRLTGKGVWGPPADRDEAVRVLRRAAELGVNFIDTADSYGPYIAEDIIREALHPYDGLVIATKAGLLRTGPDIWIPLGNPSYLRQECEMSLRRLGVDTIDLFQLHRVDRDFPLADQVGELLTLKNEGKIRHIGLSEVNVDQLTAAQQITEIVSVQNMYNLAARGAEAAAGRRDQPGHRIHSVVPAGRRSAGRRGRPAAAHRRRSPRDSVATGAGLVAETVAGDAADSGHIEGGAPGGERRRGRDHAVRRRVRNPFGGRRATDRLTGPRRASSGAIRCGGGGTSAASRRWVQPTGADDQGRSRLQQVHRRRAHAAGPRPRRRRARRGDH